MRRLSGVEELLSRAARIMGVIRVSRVLNQRRLLVLNYHGVVPDAYARDPLLYPNVVGVSEFAHQMEEVARLFSPIAASDLRTWQPGKGKPAALITFDDGYRNNLTYAAPILKQFGIPAIIAICPGYVGQKRILWPDEIRWRVLWWPEKTVPMPFPRPEKRIPAEFAERSALADDVRQACKRLPCDQVAQYLARLRKYPVRDPLEEVYAFLTWDEVLTLKAYGFEIASHTMEHPILVHLPREKLIRELRESKSIIEKRTGCDCVVFAYPNGGINDLSPVVVQEVRQAGYQFGFTVMGRLADPHDDPLLLDRIYVPGLRSAVYFEARVSGFHSALKRLLIA